jgi:hypothetical protein
LKKIVSWPETEKQQRNSVMVNNLLRIMVVGFTLFFILL